MAELAVLYGRLVGARVRGQLEYRGSLALQIVATAAITLVDLVALVVIFQNVPALDGWTLEEVALLYAIATISFAFTDLTIGHLDLFPQMIRD
nr:ABC-2 family transporter protein [Actinomycetota bacterium]